MSLFILKVFVIAVGGIEKFIVLSFVWGKFNYTVAQKGHTCKLKMLLQTKFNLQIKNVAAN